MSAVFFDALREGDVAVVIKELQKDVTLANTPNESGYPPMVLATYCNQAEVAGVLFANKADIEQRDGAGNTALLGVCFKGYTALAIWLIEQGANVNAVNSMGATALIYAATFNRVDIVSLLLKHGADATVKDARGNTALDHAEMQEFNEIVEKLKTT